MGRVIVNSEKTHRSFVSVVIFEAKKRCLPSGPNNSNYLKFRGGIGPRYLMQKFKSKMVLGNEAGNCCWVRLSVLFYLINSLRMSQIYSNIRNVSWRQYER